MKAWSSQAARRCEDLLRCSAKSDSMSRLRAGMSSGWRLATQWPSRQHAAAWKQMFDSYLSERARRTGVAFVPFDPGQDYDAYIDGKLRADGTRSFLQSRGIDLPEGTSNDPPDAETVNGLSNRKNE